MPCARHGWRPWHGTALTRLLFSTGILRLWSWRTLEATICLICKKQKRSPPKPLRPAENTRGKAPHFLVRPWKAEDVPSSVFDTLTSARHSSAAGSAVGGAVAAWPNAMADGLRALRERAPVEVIFHLAAKVRVLSLEPPLHTHRDAPLVPRRN